MTRNTRRTVLLLASLLLLPAALFAAPSITSLSPTSGAVGASVTITGTAFGSTQSTSTVTFNGTAATTITSWSATSIVVTVPTGATTGSVVVTVSGTASNKKTFTVVAAPDITSLSLTSGAVGAAVTITGTGFTSTEGTVTFNGVAASITSWAASSIKVTVPSGATTGNVVVFASGVYSNGVSFTVLPTPDITSLSPSSAAVGASVTIAGTAFASTQGTGTVTFNGTKATITSWSATSIVVTVPTAATTGNVVVNASGVASNGVLFTVLATPTISTLSPSTGAIGASVTITGTGFGTTQGTGSVTFNGTQATVSSWSATSILTTVPTGATTGDVVVNTSGVASKGVKFTVVAAPSITKLSVTSGAVGTAVTITGTSFGSTQGTGMVTFNGTSATVTSWAASSIKVTVPTGATTGNVVVYASGVYSNGETFTVFPSISSLSPSSAAIGAAVMISGLNFGSTQGSSTVKFNTTTATSIVSWSSTAIVAVMPAGTTSGNVVITVGGNASNGVAFTVVPAPSITSLSSTSDAVGAAITITGTNFGSTQGSGSVTFNGVVAPVASWSATSIQVTVPTGATTGNVVVNASGVASNGVAFTVLPTPSITTLSSTADAVGASVTIIGTGFGSTQASGSVTFNGVTASITNWTASSITVTVPTGATTGNVVVNASGVSSNGVAFTVLGTPNISSISPTSGGVGGAVTISGSNFGSTQASGSVTFNGLTAAITSWSASSIVATVPTGATTGNVVVNASGVSSNGVSFTVLPTPTITSLSPASGAAGNSITITGTNFGSTQGASTVTFNGTSATPTSWSGTSIVVPVPAGATSGNVVVTVNGVSSNGFAFTVVSVPSITSISPTSGGVGTSVTINGTNFGSTQGSSTVSFNGTSATPTSWSATSIVVAVPAGATTGPVSVTVSGQTGSGPSFTVATLPPGWLDTDVGAVGVAGSSGYANGVFTVNGAGAEFIGTADAFHFVYQPLSGDGSIVAQVTMPFGTYASAGVTIRQGLDSSSPNATNVWWDGTLAEFTVRSAEGYSTDQVNQQWTTVGSPYWVELVRSGSTLSGYASPDGVNWTLVGSETVNMTENVYIGLVGSNATTSALTTATFADVSVNSAAAPAPVITNVSATTASIGSPVTITGSNFGAAQGGSLVTLNGVPVTINSWSNTSIGITIPSGATSGLLIVSVAPSMNDSNPVVFNVTAQPLPSGWLDIDVGAVGVPGSSSYANGVFTVNGGGGVFSGSTDGFHFVYQPLSGDGSITARLVSLPTTGSTAGIMIRETLDTASAYAGLVDYIPYGSVIEFNVRPFAGENMLEPGAVGGTAPYWLQLVRTGDTFSSYVSTDGVGWTLLGSSTITMPQNVYVGLVVNSGNTSSSATATFDCVSVDSLTAPAPVITSLSATTGPVGSQVVITGSNFGNSQGNSLVTLNDVPVTVNSWSDTSIGITIPSGATSGYVVVSLAPSMNDSNAILFTVTSQPLPSGWLDTDVGAVGIAGNSSYASGVFTLNGAGIPSTSLDAFHFVYQPVSGNGTIIARVVSMPTGGAQAGVVIRETLNPGAIEGGTIDNVPYGAYTDFIERTVTNGTLSENYAVGGTTPPYWLELTRSGNTLSSYASPDGANWTLITSQTVTMDQNVDVGLMVNSGYTNSLATATFDNVSLNFSAPTTAPSLSSLSPSVALPTMPIFITGTNFGSTQGTSTVTFNGTPGTPVYWSPTSIDVPVPSAATSGNVVVTVAGVASNALPLTISQTPTIFALSIPQGLVGAPVTISGVNFGASQGASTVTFNGTSATPSSWSPTSIVVPVPSGATSGNVVVTVASVASDGVPFTVLAQPSISSLSTGSTTIGALVTITGTNFGSTQGTSTVTFNGVGGTPASWTATGISVPVPIGATTGNVVVTVNGVASNAIPLTITLVPLPPVAQIQPGNGSTGFPENGRIIIRFAQPIPSTAVVTGTVTLFQGANILGGTLALSNDGLSVTFTPLLNLAPDSPFSVSVTAVTNNQTTAEFQSSFTTGSSTDTTAPTIVQTSPQANATDVPISAPVVVQFSKPMDPSTLTLQAFSVEDNVTGDVVPGMIQVDPAGTAASFVPQGYYGVGRNFSVSLAEWLITDSSGNNLTGPGSGFSFTTSFTTDTTGPQLLGSDPVSGATAVPQNALIVLQFNKPLDVISVTNGLQVQAAGQAVPGAIALSNSNQQVTFTPTGGLSANTTYTVTTNAQITDIGGLALTNPGSFSFTTGATSDTTTPSVISASPAYGQTGVPLNAVVQLQFSKPVDPWTVTASTFQITFGINGIVQGTTAVSSNGLTATFTPSQPLDSFTPYYVQINSGVMDMEGHPLASFGSYFTTGVATEGSGPTVVTASPANGASNVPVNVRVDLQMSAQLSAASVGSNAVVVSSAGVQVPGTVSLNGAGTILTFVPTSLLAVNTTYSVMASGSTDEAGNAVSPFMSSFTTGSSGVANTTTPSVLSVNPTNGASAVSVNSAIVLTFNEAIDATTANENTIPVSVGGVAGVLAGAYNLNATATTVTFTPLAPFPQNSSVTVQVNSGVTDLSGNTASSFSSVFTTGSGTNTTAPVVSMVTPQNGATGIGSNGTVVLTFSESLNPNTITTGNFGLLADGNVLNISVSNSADNRTVTLNPYGLPPSSTITVLATGGVTDLWGNALASYQSTFTTGPAFSFQSPSVLSQRPANGANGVPLNDNVVLYMSQPMNAASVQSALEVSQNGALISGTTQVTDNGQVVQFTPSAQWQPGALIQVFLTAGAQSVSGYGGNSYQASFMTVPNAATTAPVMTGTSPASNASGVPTNVAMAFAFSEPLDPTSLSPDSVTCYQNGTWLQAGVNVLNGGLLLEVVPRNPLAPLTVTTCELNGGVQGTNGLPLSIYSSNVLSFTTGAGPDTTIPTVLTTSPPNGTSNVGDNGNVLFVFSKPINPLTVNASTVQLSGGGVTLVPDAISFINNNQIALLVPHAPLPDGTQMTLTLSGVTDLAGNLAATQTTQFTTGSGPDVVSPFIVTTSPTQQAQNVPLNAIVVLQMSEPIDPGTIGSNTLSLGNNTTGQQVAGTYSVSADGLTITFVPGAPLTPSTGYSLSFPGAGFDTGITDLSGNPLLITSLLTFTTGSTTNTTTPQIMGTSPANGATSIPTNAQIVVELNEPVDPAVLGGVSLSQGGNAVNVSQILTNGNETLTMVPAVPLSPGTAYTATIAGLQDFSGNVLASPVTVNFTTGSGPDLSRAVVASINPTSNATGVPVNSVVTVTFSKTVDPLTVNTSTMQLFPAATQISVAGTVSCTGTTATFTPNQPLDAQTQYILTLTSGVIDLEGQTLNGGNYNSYFTTAGGTPQEPPVIDSILPGTGPYPVGQPIAIYGTYFGTSQGTSTVTFNGVAGVPTEWADTYVSVPIPAGATSGPVVVTVNGVASNGVQFSVVETPTATSISPTSGSAGTPVTITGTYLGDALDNSRGNEVVYFASDAGGNYPATPTAVSETSLTVLVPSGLAGGPATVTVTSNGAQSSGLSFTVIPTPVVSTVYPNVGVSTTPVSIQGSNFGTSQGSSTVNFNGIPGMVTSWSNNNISVVPPSNATTGPVTVIVNSVASNANFTYTVISPVISSLLPAAAAPGATVTINGSNFEQNGGQSLQVLFNGVPSPSIGCTAYYCSLENPPFSSLTAQVPSGATSGPLTVVIGGVSSNSVNFTIEAGPPTITSVSPNSGPFVNGVITPVTISGSGFGPTQTGSAINFWLSQTAPQVISWSDTQIVLWAPIDAGTGPLTVTVGGITATSPAWFYANRGMLLFDSFGDQTSYTFQDQGGQWFATSSLGPGCVTCTMRGNITNVGDGSGNILTTTDDMGNTTTYTYDSANDITSVSKPLNTNTTQTSSYTYNSFGEALTVTDPLGNVTTNTYDPHGNLLTVTAPQPNANTPASVTQFLYAPNGELTQITDPNGNVTTLNYNPVGLISSIIDAQGNVTSYQYDPRGNRTVVIDPVNGPSYPTTYYYDIMSRLRTITYPDGSTASFNYDVRGRRISATDQNGHTTSYGYDDADRMTSVTDPAFHVTQYGYDTEDNLTSIMDANGNTTTFLPNTRGWVTQTTFPSTLTESYTYDLVGNMLSKTDRNGNTIQYVYDSLYRLSTKTYPNQTAIDYYYDLANKVQSVNDPTGTYGFAYDNMGRLIGTTTQYTWLPGLSFQNAYTYDAASNRTSLTAPDGSVTTYNYDALNRLSILGNTWAGSFGFSYDALSRRTQVTRPNGITTNYGYKPLTNYLASILHQAGTNTLDGASYTYDLAGNRTTKTNYLNSITSNYSYDPLYELTQVMQGASTTESYSYDPVGNRLSSVGVPTYNYNTSNELTSNSNGSYTYDNSGNTLSDAQGRSFTWDFDNRLIQAIVTGQNGGTTTFQYDPFGRRIQKSGPLGTTNYLYDGMDSTANVIEEVDNAGNALASFAQELDVDSPLSMLSSGATSYFERDGLGSVTSLSNSAGALANTYTYDSFGNLSASTGTLTNPFQFAGREFDPETGLYNNRARYYDPKVGRFDSEDPARFQGGIDFYRYTHNNPVNRTDPDGLGAAACLKALEEWALAYTNVNRRLGLFNRYGDRDPGHAQALEEALDRLENATEDVKKKCNCDYYKAEVAAVVAATAALAARVAAVLMEICSESPVCALAKNDGYQFLKDKHLGFYSARPDREPGHGEELAHAEEALLKKDALYLAGAA